MNLKKVYTLILIYLMQQSYIIVILIHFYEYVLNLKLYINYSQLNENFK